VVSTKSPSTTNTLNKLNPFTLMILYSLVRPLITLKMLTIQQ
jgi:hypothetical protein